MLRTVKQEKRPVFGYSIPVYKIALVKEASIDMDEEKYCSPDQVAKMLSKYYAGADREHFVVVMLNGKNRIIGFNTVSIGSLNQATVHPREVFKPAVASSAATVILSHNHPTGDPEPSLEDRMMTDKLKAAGDILGIKVLDHMIMGAGEKYFSFSEEEAAAEAQREADEAKQVLKRRIEWAEKAVARGSATGEEIVFLVANRIGSVHRGDPTTNEIITRLEKAIMMLIPVSERKRGPVKVRKSALDWIDIASRLIKEMER